MFKKLKYKLEVIVWKYKLNSFNRRLEAFKRTRNREFFGAANEKRERAIWILTHPHPGSNNDLLDLMIAPEGFTVVSRSRADNA